MDRFDHLAFPRGKRRKEVLQKNIEDIEAFKIDGANRIRQNRYYSWVDSSTDGPDGIGRPFVKSFDEVLPYSGVFNNEKSFRDYVEKILSQRKGKAIGIEFGGVGSNAFASFSPGFFSKSIGVTLVDHRDHTDPDLQKYDKQIHHETLIGDIFDSNTYISLNRKLENNKVDFIVSRMAAGLEFVPVEPFTVTKILKIWYGLLREEGIMFVQTPVVFNHLLEEWSAEIKRKLPKVLEIKYALGDDNSSTDCSSFRLRKLSGAPSELPLLNPKEVGRIRRW